MPCKNAFPFPLQTRCRLWAARVMVAGWWFVSQPGLHAEILWHDADARVVHHSGDGYDILGGNVRRDDTANDTLYFKFHVNPLSDVGTEEYFAAFQLFEGNEHRRGDLHCSPELQGGA